jgi:hypothetical protein
MTNILGQIRKNKNCPSSKNRWVLPQNKESERKEGKNKRINITRMNLLIDCKIDPQL